MFHVSLSLASLESRDSPFVRSLNVTRTGPEFISQIAHRSHGISSLTKPGSRIILLAKSSASSIEALLAIMDSGCIAVPINTRWSEREVSHALTLVQPALIIVDVSHYPLIESSMERLRSSCAPSPSPHGHSSSWVLSCQIVHLDQGSHLEPLIDPTSSTPEPALTYSTPGPALQLKSPSDGTALIVFTSGTSSSPKAVLLSHANLHCQSLAKLTQPPAVGYRHEDVYLHLAPLFHIGGISSLLASLMAGAKQVLMPSFDPLVTLELIGEEQVTCFIAVPTIIQDLIRAAGSSQFEGVGKILVGAGGMNQMTKDAIAHTFPKARLCTAYGMSEACSSITCDEIPPSSLASPARPSSSRHAHRSLVGRPLPGIEIKIDPWKRKDGEELAFGIVNDIEFEYGEVLTRGPHVMVGYYNDPEATSHAMTIDGWLKTGDLGYLDSGDLWLLGRSKDVVKTGGENIFASEVEEALVQCPGIAQAAVVGLLVDRLGEKVAALVVLHKGVSWDGPWINHPSTSPPPLQGQRKDTLTPNLLKEQCRDQGLSGFKLPRLIAAQYHPLPLNASGKVECPTYSLQ